MSPVRECEMEQTTRGASVPYACSVSDRARGAESNYFLELPFCYWVIAALSQTCALEVLKKYEHVLAS